MSYKRKSPPTKLEGSGSLTPTISILQQQNQQELLSCNDLLPGYKSPSNNSDNGGSEPDAESYRSTTPTSEFGIQEGFINSGGGGGGGVEDVDAGNNSDCEEPCKKQKLTTTNCSQHYSVSKDFLLFVFFFNCNLATLHFLFVKVPFC